MKSRPWAGRDCKTTNKKNFFPCYSGTAYPRGTDNNAIIQLLLCYETGLGKVLTKTRTDFVQRPAALTRYLNRKDQKRLRVL